MHPYRTHTMLAARLVVSESNGCWVEVLVRDFAPGWSWIRTFTGREAFAPTDWLDFLVTVGS